MNNFSMRERREKEKREREKKQERERKERRKREETIDNVSKRARHMNILSKKKKFK